MGYKNLNCLIAGCTKRNIGGDLCSSHGGGNRCVIPDCFKQAADAKIRMCISHGGGGKKCIHKGCSANIGAGSTFCVEKDVVFLDVINLLK